MADGLDIAFFGSSLLSSWWNGACTYYRGILSGLHGLGHRVTFYEPRAFGRQEHRDIGDIDYAEVVVYAADSESPVSAAVRAARGADVVVKASGVGVHDEFLESAVARADGALRIFWDVDAPATLARLERDPGDPLRAQLPRYDVIVTYGGGERVRERYAAAGAQRCEVVYNGLDPATHHPVDPDPRFTADCSLLANRLPDRERRIDEFFFAAARLLPERQFLLGGNGWDDKAMPANVRWIGHVGTAEHNAFNCSAICVLNVTRDSMAANGWSPPTRIFEAAGAGACVITDAWAGVDDFFTPGHEMLVAADAAEVAAHVDGLDAARSRRIGARAADRALAAHTYGQRAAQVDDLLRKYR